MATGAAADEFRIQPSTEIDELALSVAFVGPYVVTLGVNDTLRITEAAAGLDAVVAAAAYNATTLAAAIKAALEAAGASANTYTVTQNPNTLLWTFTRATGADAVELLWSHANTTIGTLLGSDGVDDTGATTYTNPNTTPYNMGFAYKVNPGMRFGMNTVIRSSVPGNLMRMRIVGLSSAFVPSFWFQKSTGLWSATTVYDELRTTDEWESHGWQFEIPMGVKYLTFQLSNGSADACAYDIGEFKLEESSRIIAKEATA
jgi:hypothetical protein